MTDETKKLFDAPWTVKYQVHEGWGTGFEIDTTNGMGVAVSPREEDANRLARLPELYDALMQATEDACRTCNHEKAEGILDRPCDDLHANECYVAEWRKLLRKVRDGE